MTNDIIIWTFNRTLTLVSILRYLTRFNCTHLLNSITYITGITRIVLDIEKEAVRHGKAVMGNMVKSNRPINQNNIQTTTLEKQCCWNTLVNCHRIPQCNVKSYQHQQLAKVSQLWLMEKEVGQNEVDGVFLICTLFLQYVCLLFQRSFPKIVLL